MLPALDAIESAWVLRAPASADAWAAAPGGGAWLNGARAPLSAAPVKDAIMDFLLGSLKQGESAHMISKSSLASVLLPICLGLCACGDESEKPSKQSSEIQDRMKADADLMLDAARAGNELERRLTEAVRAQEGVVIFHDPLTGKFFLHVLSPNTQWVLTCGVGGISVAFGSSVSGDSTSMGNDVEFRVAYNTVDEGTCASLGPRLGKRLNAIFREASAQ
jgi:hypothetical protein